MGYAVKGVMMRVSNLPGVQTCATADEELVTSDPDATQDCASTAPVVGDGRLYAVSGPLHAVGATISWTYQVF